MPESDELKPADGYWQIRYKLRSVEQWRLDVTKDREQLEKRIRELEDFKLMSTTTHRNLIKWTTLAASCFAAAISFLIHFFFK